MPETAQYIGTGCPINESAFEALKRNGRRAAVEDGAGEGDDFYPVVKLFTPDAGRTWLLTEIDPDDPDKAYGLVDLEDGSPAFGAVSLSELWAYRGPKGLRIERDIHFTAIAPISDYADVAFECGVGA